MANVPLRPILSMVGSAQHKLAKFLNFVLEPVTKKFSRHTIKDSFTFVEALKGLKVDNTYMASFDVKSLFTSVPLNEVINICANELYQESNIELSKENFIALMKMATSETQFSFNNNMYSQIDGVAMGSPLGPTLANIFMGHLEHIYFNSNDMPIMYFRYVDDCFVVFNNISDCNRMFNAFNNLHKAIKFTMETEVENKLPFLDVMIERSDNKLITSIYRKLTFKGQYINFQSFCSVKRKTNLIRTLCDRAAKICSPERLKTELEYISKILQENGYPEKLIRKVMEQRLNTEVKQKVMDPDLRVLYLKLPFVGEQSYLTETKLKKSTKECYKTIQTRLVWCSKPNFTPATKDHIQVINKSKVVYHYQCHCDNDYVGQTARRLMERVREHVPPHRVYSGS